MNQRFYENTTAMQGTFSDRALVSPSMKRSNLKDLGTKELSETKASIDELVYKPDFSEDTSHSDELGYKPDFNEYEIIVRKITDKESSLADRDVSIVHKKIASSTIVFLLVFSIFIFTFGFQIALIASLIFSLLEYVFGWRTLKNE